MKIQNHLASLRQEYTAAGLGAEEAHYAALRQMGGVEQVKEKCREQRGANVIESVSCY
jgi:hypothetical protein